MIRPLIDKADCQCVVDLAHIILPDVYRENVPYDHIEFLLEKFYNQNDLERLLSDSNYYNYLIIVGEQKVGYLSLVKLGTRLKLDKLYLLPEYRGTGVGAKAILFTIEKSEIINCSEIELIVQKDNRRAILFYEKFHFKVEKELHHDFENGHSLDGFLMVKKLK